MIKTEISSNIISALKIIVQELESQDIKWAISTSCALALQGIKIKPSDIDIITDNAGAIEISNILKKYETESLKHVPSQKFDSTMNKSLINNCDVDVVGDFKIKSDVDNKWHNMTYMLESLEIVEVEQTKIPVLSLLQSMEMYKLMGRGKDLVKVEIIKKHLK